MKYVLLILCALVLWKCKENDRNLGVTLTPQIKKSPSTESQKNPEITSDTDFHFDSLENPSKPHLPSALREFQNLFSDVAEKAIPAVVSIYSERNVANPASGSPYDDFLDEGPFNYFFGDSATGKSNTKPRKESGLGSGVIISPSGYILTNYHVIEGADVIKVQLSDETEFPGTVVGADKPSDLAVIKITVVNTKLPTLPMGNSDKLRIGEWVLAVGNPYGLSHTVTTGIISAKGRKNTGINSYENFLQTDAAINPGNSGGALLNLSGELIGINSAIFTRSGGYQGIGFAIPINMAKKITEDLIRDGSVTRGWLGVSIQPISAELAEAIKLKNKSGALVGGVVPGSPAEKAGIKRGDVITKIGDEEIKDASDLLNQIALLVPSHTVSITVIRDRKILSIQSQISKRDDKRLTLFHREENLPSSLVGLQVAGLNQELKDRFRISKSLNYGVVVIAIEPTSRAAGAKIKVGDVILEMNRIKILNLDQFRLAMAQATKGNKILLLMHRMGSTFFTAL